MLLWWSLALAGDPPIGGVYERIVDHTEAERLHAVTRAETLQALPWAWRPIARPALSRVIYSCGRLALSLDEARLTLVCDDKPAEELVRTVDGAPSPIHARQHVRVSVTDDAVVLDQTRPEGALHTRMYLDGDELVVHKALRCGPMAVPTEWELRYRPMAP